MEDIEQALAKLVKSGKTTYERDSHGHVTRIECRRDNLNRDMYEFSADGRLMMHTSTFDGMPERQNTFRFDSSGVCISWDQWRYDGAWEWNGLVTFDEHGEVLKSEGVLVKEMTGHPRPEGADLMAIVRSLLERG